MSCLHAGANSSTSGTVPGATARSILPSWVVARSSYSLRRTGNAVALWTRSRQSSSLKRRSFESWHLSRIEDPSAACESPRPLTFRDFNRHRVKPVTLPIVSPCQCNNQLHPSETRVAFDDQRGGKTASSVASSAHIKERQRRGDVHDKVESVAVSPSNDKVTRPCLLPRTCGLHASE